MRHDPPVLLILLHAALLAMLHRPTPAYGCHEYYSTEVLRLQRTFMSTFREVLVSWLSWSLLSAVTSNTDREALVERF